MPTIRPISDLRNSANEISDFCRQTRQPVYITRNGTGDMVVLSMEEYERQQALIDLYGKLAVAEQEVAGAGAPLRHMGQAGDLFRQLVVVAERGLSGEGVQVVDDLQQVLLRGGEDLHLILFHGHVPSVGGPP